MREVLRIESNSKVDEMMVFHDEQSSKLQENNC